MQTDFIDIEQLCFIGGSRQEIIFELFDEYDEPLDLSSATAEVALGDYCNRSITYIKKAASIEAGTDSNSNVKNVILATLETNDTENLHGKFILQLQIKLSENDLIIPIQGVLDIQEKLK